MGKKITQYLPFALGLIALLILLVTSCGRGAGESSAEPTTDPAFTESMDTEAPVTDDETPELKETLPADAMERVEQALGRYVLDETAMAFCVYDGTLNEDDTAQGLGRDANANALARLCDEQKMNPVAAFWLLVSEGLYDKTYDASGMLPVPAFSVPKQTAKTYAYDAEGVRELLTDILTLSGTIDDGMKMDTRLLGENGMVDEGQIFHREGECYYAYFVFYGDSSAHFLCFYLRGDALIEDVEIQLLNLRYAQGDEEFLNRIDQRGDRQATTLMAAAELLMTGHSRADQGRVPFNYELADWDAAIERYTFAGYGETGSLTNYRIYK